MERRSKSKPQLSINPPRLSIQQQKFQRKERKNQQKKLAQKDEQEKLLQKVKVNILVSLRSVFLSSKYEHDFIYPWTKSFNQLSENIIGTNHLIIGPCQSGKYSAVRYALDKFHPNVTQIYINCDVNTTEHQFYTEILDQFVQKFPKVAWPSEQRDMNNLIVNQNIDFSRLNPYIIKNKLKFVIVIRSGQHLAFFKKQTILYNLFEWLNMKEIQKIAGLVICTRQLMFFDRLEKRIRSRFSAKNICIFRPEDPDVFVKIISKRIQSVINDRRISYQQFNLKSAIKIQQQQQCEHFFQDSDQIIGKRKNRSKSVKNQPSKGTYKNLKLIIQKNADNPQIKYLNGSYQMLFDYTSPQIFRGLKLDDYFEQKVRTFEMNKNSKKQDAAILESDGTSLTVKEQLQCLNKFKQAVQKNDQMKHFLKQILDLQIISIPYILSLFQHMCMLIDESLLKFLSLKDLKTLFNKLLITNCNFQFPLTPIQCYMLEDFNNVELLLLIFIYRMIAVEKKNPVKLTTIYHDYKSFLNKQIHHSYQTSSNKFPISIIEGSMQRLRKSKIISYSPQNIWNSEIILLYELKNIRIGLQRLATKKNLPDILMLQLKDMNINADKKQSQQISINLTIKR